MIPFDFSHQTRIVFGEGRLEEVGSLIAAYGFRRVLFVYGGSHIKKSGVYGRVVACLKQASLSFEELSGIRPNPEIASVKEGLNLVKKTHADVILAIGGGSVIDVGKAIAASSFYEGDPADFTLHKTLPSQALPLVAVPTIASAGSESSDSCVISIDELGIKKGFNSDLVRPLVALEDPTLTYDVPPFETAVGIADIMMHSLERYLSPSYPYQLSDDWALSLCRRTMEAGKAALRNPYDPDARAALLLLSSLSHDGLTSLGKKAPFVVHPLQMSLAGPHPEMVHGEGVAVVYLGYARVMSNIIPGKFAGISRALFNIDGIDERNVAIMGIDAMEAFYRSMGLKTSLSELGIKPSEIPALASRCSGNGTRVVGLCPQSLDEKGIARVYRACL